MHRIVAVASKVWNWLLADNASRATVIVVFVTAWYAILTWRMAKAIARQTRAMIQPVILLEFHWDGARYGPAGYVEIKNVGSQPLLVLDAKLSCHAGGGIRLLTDQYTLFDQHIIPPGESLCPKFDFEDPLVKEKLRWNPMGLSYSLQVAASDLSTQIILTYTNIPVLGISNVHKGMPLSVHWRHFVRPFGWRYHRLLNRFKRPKVA